MNLMHFIVDFKKKIKYDEISVCSVLICCLINFSCLTVLHYILNSLNVFFFFFSSAFYVCCNTQQYSMTLDEI